MLGLFISVLIVLAFPVLCTVVYNKKIEQIIPFSIFGIVFVLYAFGLLNILKIGCYSVLITAIVMYVYSIYKVIKSKKIIPVIKNIFTPAFVIWCVFIAFIVFVEYGRLYYTWDEFTHWGSAVYDMYFINALSNSPHSLTNLPTYPQAITVFQYFFQFFNPNGYREWLSFIAYQLIYISIFSSLITKLNWRKKDIILILLMPIVIFALPLLLYNDFYTSIYVDAILGIIFGYSLILVWSIDNYGKSNMCRLLLSLFMLVLTKDSGVVLAFVCFLNLLIRILFFDKKIIEVIKMNLKEKIKYIKPIILTLLFIVAVYIIWHFSFKLYHYPGNSTVGGISGYGTGIGDFINLLLGKDNTYLTDVLNIFNKKMFDYKMILGKISMFWFVILILIIYKVWSLLDKKNNRDSNYIIVSILIGFFIYSLFLLYSYCTFFGKTEALLVASVNRYTFSYILGLLLLIIFKMITDKKYLRLVIALLLIVISLLYYIKPYNTYKSLISRSHLDKGIEYRNAWFRGYVDETKNKINKQSRVFIVSQGSNGLDYWILRYELRSVIKKVNPNIYGIIPKKYTKKYTYINEMSQKDFEKEIFSNYDYLILFASDDLFIQNYGKYFEDSSNIGNKQVYKVNKKKHKLVLLED